jgi:molecular chaperone HscB
MHPQEDLFSLFNLSEKFQIDRPALQARFYELSRELHPDRFAAAAKSPEGIEALRNAMEKMALLNRAYQVLKDPISLRKWMCREYASSGGKTASLPLDWAEEWFELQESKDLNLAEGFLAKLLSKKGEIEAQAQRLEQEFDQTNDEQRKKEILSQLQKTLDQNTYFDSLERDLRTRFRVGSKHVDSN